MSALTASGSTASTAHASYLRAVGLAATHDGDPLFAGVDLLVNSGEHLGVVGPNGAGKSTLLRILAGHQRADAGAVTYGPADRVGYLDHQAVQVHGTIETTLAGGFDEVHRIAVRLRELERHMADHRDDQAPAEYAELQDRWILLRGWEVESRTAEVRERLGIAHLDGSTPMTALSGGEQARVTLARLLLEEPSILLLDEPTNHLDGAGLVWLGDYLAAYRGAVVVVTHDRAFLDRTVHRIVELDLLTDAAKTYEGGYTAYREEKLRRRARLLADFEVQETYRLRLEEDIARTAGQARATELSTRNDRLRRYAKKVAKKAKARENRLRREMAAARWIERPQDRPPLVLGFAAASRPDAILAALDGTTVDHGAGPLWTPLTARVRGQDRILVTGENGTGKTTLLQLLSDRLTPISGSVDVSANVGLLPQAHDNLPLRMSVIDYLRREVPLYEEDAERLLDSYLFDASQFHRPLSTLSAGELRRLLLACLVNGGAELLLLDEPTNYLDFDSLDVLEAALAEFRGTLVAVSHDNRFAEALRPTQRWHLADRTWSQTRA